MVSERTVITPAECAQELLGMVRDTPQLDSLQVKAFFKLGFFTVRTVADIQEEHFALKAFMVSVLAHAAFGPNALNTAIPEFHRLISSAARSSPLYARIESHLPAYWTSFLASLADNQVATANQVDWALLSQELGATFARHCNLKDPSHAIAWVGISINAVLSAVDDLRTSYVLE